ncbi:MAG: pepsin/retropepsin-like aspartic protease family protein [Verrucomicrobiota bacterium]
MATCRWRCPFEGANRQSVAAWVNGRKLRLLVDTGSRHTCLTAACARSLGLDVHDTGQPLIGMGGLAGGNEGIAPVCSFTLRYGEASRAGTVTVLPGSVGLGEHDGILGLDVLAGGAAIYPVSGAALLVRAGTAPPVAIAELMTRLGFRAAPVTLARGRLWIDGHILGRAMQFVVDTGAYFSDFNAESVRAAGGPLAPAMLPLTGVDGRRQTSYGFMARAMDLGGVRPRAGAAAGHALGGLPDAALRRRGRLRSPGRASRGDRPRRRYALAEVACATRNGSCLILSWH